MLKSVKGINKGDLIFWGVAVVLILPRIILSFFGSPLIYSEGLAILDDGLMYEAAKSIVDGNWLGEYGPYTIGKNMFFALFLAFVHITGIPYLVMVNILFLLACLFFTFAISPIIKNRYIKLAIFAFISYNPIMFESYNQRLYRDSIYPALVLIVFGGVIGIALRYKKRAVSSIFYAVLGGLAFGAAYLNREDGIWLLPFIVCGIGATVLFILLDKQTTEKIKKIIISGSLLVVAGVVITAYAYMNYLHYGRFILNDFTSSEFAGAYGQMLRYGNEEFMPVFPLSYQSRVELYEASPMLEELAVDIEKATWNKVYNGVYDISGGGLYWGLRGAAAEKGVYSDPITSKEYFESLEAELISLYDSGELEARYNFSPSLSVPFDLDVIHHLVPEMISSFEMIFFYNDFDYYPSTYDLIYNYQQEQLNFVNEGVYDSVKVVDENIVVKLWAATAFDKIVDIELYDKSGEKIDFSYRREAAYDVADSVSQNNGFKWDINLESRFIIEAQVPYGEYFEIVFHTSSDVFRIGVTESGELTNGEGFISYIEDYYSIEKNIITSDIVTGIYLVVKFLGSVYSAITLPLFLFSLFLIFYKINIKKDGLVLLILLGILLSIIMRVAMVSYVEVTAFGIGTYAMYLSSVFPLLLAFIAISFSFLGKINFLKKRGI